MKNLLNILFSLICVISCSVKAFAGCDPKEDPCAPKKVMDAWDSSAAIGFNATSGNSKTTLLTILGTTRKETKKDIWDFNIGLNFGQDKNREDTVNGSTVRKDLRAGALYRYLLDDRWYLGMGTNFLYDKIADIDYRVTIIPTAGYFLVKNDDIKFALEAGPGYIIEKVGGDKNDYLAPRIGDRFDYIISCSSKIYQTAEVLFDVNDSKNYLMNAEAGLETAISSKLGLIIGIRNQYDNTPAIGKMKSDVTTFTALKVAL